MVWFLLVIAFIAYIFLVIFISKFYARASIRKSLYGKHSDSYTETKEATIAITICTVCSLIVGGIITFAYVKYL